MIINRFNFQDENVNEEGESDYKKGQQFAEHMKNTGHASSNFAKNKSFIQQRQYLPAFAVREQVSYFVVHKRI